MTDEELADQLKTEWANNKNLRWHETFLAQARRARELLAGNVLRDGKCDTYEGNCMCPDSEDFHPLREPYKEQWEMSK